MLNGEMYLFQMVRAEEMTRLKMKMDIQYPGSFTLLSDNTVAVSGQLNEQSSPGVHVYDMQGRLQFSEELPCDCDLKYHGLLGVTLNSHRYLAISCRARREIWLYNFTTQSFRLVYSDPSKRGPEPGYMCIGPNNTILAQDHTDGSRSVAEFHFTSEDNLILSRFIPVQCDKDDIRAVYYAETTQGPLLFSTHWSEYAIRATYLQSGHIQWQVKGKVDGKKCNPQGLCHDAGRLYVANGDNKCILVLDAATGDFIQSIEVTKTAYVWNVAWRSDVWNVAWSEQQPHLVVLHKMYKAEAGSISYFNSYIPVPDKADSPLETIMGSDAFKKAVTRGTTPYQYARIVVTGKYGDGKTSLIKALLGKDIPQTHIPTEGMDAQYTCKVDITKCTEDWSELLIEKTYIVDNQIINAVVKHNDKNDNLQRKEGNQNLKKKEKAKERKSLASMIPKSSSIKTTDKPLYNRVIAKKSAMKAKQQSQKTSEEDNKATLFIWDFAGQEVYTNLHPVFLRSDCVYIVVYDLEKLGELEKIPNKKELKDYLNEIEFWLKMIQSNCNMPNDKARPQRRNVLLVGTHKDRLLGESLEEKAEHATKLEEQIQRHLKGKKCENLITSYFHVDNKGGTQQDTESFNKLKECLIGKIKECPSWKEERPISYMRLLQKLYQQEESPEHAIMTFDRIKTYAEEYDIASKEEVQQFLIFHHTTGDLTFFPDMNDFIIVNAQWLMDVFTRVITIKRYRDQMKHIDQEELHRLGDEGLIKRDGSLLAELWRWKKLVHNDDAVISHLKQLMCKFDLMMEYGERCYLVPCLLKKAYGLDQPQRDSLTIYLQFHGSPTSKNDFLDGHDRYYDHFLPPALYHQLICRLASSHNIGWIKDSDNCLRNTFEFLNGDKLITVAVKSNWIRISLISDNETDFSNKSDAAEVLGKVRAQLEQLLKNCYRNVWYEFYVNPCHGTLEGTEDCITSTGHSSIGARGRMARCKLHKRKLKTTEYNFWFGKLFNSFGHS